MVTYKKKVRGSLTIKKIDDSLLTEDSSQSPYYERQIKTLRITADRKNKRFIVYEHNRKRGYKRIKTYKQTKKLKTKQDVINKIQVTNFRIQDKGLVLGNKTTKRVQTNYIPNTKKPIQVIGVCHIIHTPSGKEDIVLGFSKPHHKGNFDVEKKEIDDEIRQSAGSKFSNKHPNLKLDSKSPNLMIDILDRRYTYFTFRG